MRNPAANEAELWHGPSRGTIGVSGPAGRPILGGKLTGSGADRIFEIDGGTRVPVPADAIIPEGAKLVSRPHHASLGDAGPTGDGKLALPCTVANREFLGASVRYGARIGTTEVAVDVPFQSGSGLFEVGSGATLRLSPHALLWLAA